MKKKLNQQQAYKEGIEFQFIEPLPMSQEMSRAILSNPSQLSTVFARYKFIARMLTGFTEVIEVGCTDGSGTPIVAEFVKRIIAYDPDSVMIQDNRKRLKEIKNIEFEVGDMVEKVPAKKFHAVYSLGFFQKLNSSQKSIFLQNCVRVLDSQGVCILGVPNRNASHTHNADPNREQSDSVEAKHIKELLSTYFANVFVFSMNNELVHTGFTPMAEYLMILCVGPIKKNIL